MWVASISHECIQGFDLMSGDHRKNPVDAIVPIFAAE